MNTNSGNVRAIAEILIASAAMQHTARSADLAASIALLRPSLLALMGQGGLRVLVERALYLVSRKFPELRNVKANNDGSFVGLGEACASLGDVDIGEARICILAEVLLLLLQFLGPGVTLAVVSDVWPNASLGQVSLSQAKQA